MVYNPNQNIPFLILAQSPVPTVVCRDVLDTWNELHKNLDIAAVKATNGADRH